jgi:hypothetical protein
VDALRSRAWLRRLGVLVAAPALLTLACGTKNNRRIPIPTPGPGLRTLSLSANPRMIPTPTTQDYVDAMNLAKAAGVRGQFLSYTWSAIEPTNGQLSVTGIKADIQNVQTLGVANKFLLGLQCINTTSKEVPADLKTTAWDAPTMIARFHQVIDALAANVSPSSITWISIGNEVDVYLASTNQWILYKTFYDDAVAYIHVKLPGVKVGVTFTFDGASGTGGANFTALNTSSDAIVLTYYPLGANFHPRGGMSAVTDLPAMVTMAGSRPLVLQEFGYPADAQYLGSSETEQGDFIANGLATWSGIGGNKIPFLNIFLMHDFTQALCDYYGQYYGLPNSAEFKAYLCSIGLRKADGTPKAGWNAFTKAAVDTGLP